MRLNKSAIVVLAAFFLLGPPLLPRVASSFDQKKDEKKKPVEPYEIKRVTRGLGLYAIGPLSPDGKRLLILAQKPESAPNLYIMEIEGFAIRPALTQFNLGVADPSWSADGNRIVVAGYDETATFPEIHVLDLEAGRMRRLTRNGFTDREPVFTPDGRSILYTTDESPLPEAAFGILHIATIDAAGGTSDYFTEDDISTIRPGVMPDGSGILLVEVNEHSGRHSLMEYGFDGKRRRSLTDRRFARIHGYFPSKAGGFIAIWGQQEPEQQESIFVLDLGTGAVTELPDPDIPKRSAVVSPDGKRIAFLGLSPTGPQVFLHTMGSLELEQLTITGPRTHSPVFISNDRIVFGADRDAERELYVIDLSRPVAEKKK